MTTYFFDVTDGDGSTLDDAGEDFSTGGAVEAEIARIMADFAHECIRREKRGHVTVKARDETGRVAYAGSLMFTIKKLGDG